MDRWVNSVSLAQTHKKINSCSYHRKIKTQNHCINIKRSRTLTCGHGKEGCLQVGEYKILPLYKNAANCRNRWQKYRGD